MTRRTPILVLAAMTSVLASCGGSGDRGNEATAAETTENAAEAGVFDRVNAAEADEAASQESGAPGAAKPGTALPPPGGLRFVGLWASDAKRCADQAWRFTRDSLQTPAGPVCQFINREEAAGGYDISARCTVEGPPEDDRLRIRFAESAKAMLFEADTIPDAGLVWCGTPDSAQAD